MPLYEYQCDECGHRFERIQKFSDEPVKTCPSCGGTVQKLVSSPAIQFKGTGWYITDYARKPSGGQPGAEAQKGEGQTKDSKESDTTKKKDASSDSKASSSEPKKTSPPSA